MKYSFCFQSFKLSRLEFKHLIGFFQIRYKLTCTALDNNTLLGFFVDRRNLIMLLDAGSGCDLVAAAYATASVRGEPAAAADNCCAPRRRGAAARSTAFPAPQRG